MEAQIQINTETVLSEKPSLTCVLCVVFFKISMQTQKANKYLSESRRHFFTLKPIHRRRGSHGGPKDQFFAYNIFTELILTKGFSNETDPILDSKAALTVISYLPRDVLRGSGKLKALCAAFQTMVALLCTPEANPTRHQGSFSSERLKEEAQLFTEAVLSAC